MSAIQQVLTGISGSGAPSGQQEFTIPGTYSWVCPAGVTSVSVVCVGGGGPGYMVSHHPGSGGALAYKNNIAVTPGTSYSVVVGAGATFNTDNATSSSFNGSLVGGHGFAGSSKPILTNTGSVGTPAGHDGGGYGGRGGNETGNPAGSGGAGGYSGNGGNGANSGGLSGNPGSGGGGGGGGSSTSNGWPGDGGGVGIYGAGSNGAGGTPAVTPSPAGAGSGGSRMTFGGAGVNVGVSPYNAGGGAVRIIWPGNLRKFPSTRTADE